MLNVFTGVSDIFHNGVIREWRKVVQYFIHILLRRTKSKLFLILPNKIWVALFASSTKCSGGRLIILIILPAIICTHLKYFLHSAQKNQQGMLILNLQSLRQKKIMRQKTKVHLMVFKSVSSVFNHIKHRVKNAAGLLCNKLGLHC